MLSSLCQTRNLFVICARSADASYSPVPLVLLLLAPHAALASVDLPEAGSVVTGSPDSPDCALLFPLLSRAIPLSSCWSVPFPGKIRPQELFTTSKSHSQLCVKKNFTSSFFYFLFLFF